MAAVDLQPITVRTGCDDRVGCLVMVEGELAAILVRLDDKMHEADAGKWFLEAVFGPLRGKEAFDSLDDARDWISGQVACRPDGA